MTDFGFQPGIVDYWMLLTDWRNGSFSILVAAFSWSCPGSSRSLASPPSAGPRFGSASLLGEPSLRCGGTRTIPRSARGPTTFSIMVQERHGTNWVLPCLGHTQFTKPESKD
jgi:hypothetical protein